MQAAQQLMPVPFYEDTIVLVGKDYEPLVAMKPIVINMGLDWKSQHAKVTEKFSSVMVEITTTGGDGKQYAMTCLPLRKLPAWLYSISPNKVKHELREKIIRYQEECDDVLWEHWSKGEYSRINPFAGAGTNVSQQIALSNHRVKLLTDLQRTRDRGSRAAIHEQIAHVSQALCLSVPEIDSIGVADLTVPDVLAEFWGALEELDAKGLKYNHSKNPNLLALNLVSLAHIFLEQGIQIIFNRDLRDALKRSRQPLYMALKTVDSAIEAGVKKCWIFSTSNQTTLSLDK